MKSFKFDLEVGVLKFRLSSYGSDSDVLRLLGSRTDLKCVRVFMDDCTVVDGSREQLDALVDEVLDDNVDRIFILSEAGINYLKKVFKHNNVTLVSIL